MRPDASVTEILALAGAGVAEEKGHQLVSPGHAPSSEGGVATGSKIRRGGGGGGEFVLTGLHTCGDLSATMIRMFARSKRVVALVNVGCCYMKLTHSSSFFLLHLLLLLLLFLLLLLLLHLLLSLKLLPEGD